MSRRVLIATAVLAGAAALTTAVLLRARSARLGRSQELVRRGEEQLDHGQFAHALQSFLEARLLTPRKPRVHLGLCRALLNIGRYAEAEGECRLVTRAAPGDGEGHAWLGIVLNTLGQAQPAEDELRLGLAYAPDQREPRQVLVKLQLRTGRSEEALASARAFLAAGGDRDAVLHYLEGDALLHLSRAEEARVALARSLELDPTSEAAWIKMAEAKRVLGDEVGSREATRKYAELSTANEPPGARGDGR